MLQMLRGRPTLVYLTDLMKKVGAVDGFFQVEEDGSTTVDLILPDGRVKRQVLPRTAKVIDDKRGNEHGL